MRVWLYAAALSLVSLVGCGGGGDGGSGSGSGNPGARVVKNGVYTSDVDNTVMLIDAERKDWPAVLYDNANKELYLVEKGTTSADRYIGEGLYYTNQTGQLKYDATKKMEARFNNNQVTVAGTNISGQILTFFMSKNQAPFTVSYMYGKSINISESGNTKSWDFEEDGQFTITDSNNCIFNGQLTDNGYYSSATNVVVSNCNDPDYDANNYKVIIFPFTRGNSPFYFYLALRENPDGSLFFVRSYYFPKV
ncbi:hypothetical protein [Vibrio sp. 99-8-1]|uniref:hypothetical protein n=1 Tax=Vibrio sp. 99-8-1 TaxID=2607602 RepID=UPI0014937135|nr:hypothetical protein [Vibrio sp. 99-8-1]NOI67873.1 hypothetical protein [Vibrio sp. 99-8-1]